MGVPPDPVRVERTWAASYPPGVPPTYHLPEVGLPRLLQDAARDFPDHPAVEVGSRSLTYAELHERVGQLVQVLLAWSEDALPPSGSLKGAKVLVRLDDPIAKISVLFALWQIGAAAVPVGAELSRDHLAELTDRLPIAGIIASPRGSHQDVFAEVKVLLEVDDAGGTWWRRFTRRVPRFSRFRQRSTDVSEPPIALIDGELEYEARDLDVHDPRDHPQAEVLDTGAPERVDPSDAAVIVVGGDASRLTLTTHTHHTLIASAFQVRLWVPDVQAGRERLLLAEPLHDVTGLTVGLIAGVLAGATVILPAGRHELARTIQRSRPSLLVARVWRIERLEEDAEGSRDDLTSLRVVLALGDGLSPRLVASLERRSAGARVRTLTGIGDAVVISHGQPVYGRVVATSWGLPVTSTLAVITDPDDPSVIREPDQPGRLLVHGPQIAAQTDDGELARGWLVTDTIGMVNRAGWFTPVGRVDEVIEVGGTCRSPATITRVIEAEARVRDVEVVAYDDRLIAAVLPSKRRASTPVDQIGAMLAAHLDHRLLPDEVVSVDSLERDDDGTVHLEELRERIAAAQQRHILQTPYRLDTDYRPDTDGPT